MKKFKFIDQIGVELEGGWKNEKVSHPKYRSLLHSDGSVNVCGDMPFETAAKYHVGEIQTPPFQNLSLLINFLKNFYPDLQNHTCGYHIHISLKNDLYYSRLMDKAFHEYILKGFKKWGEKAQKKWGTSLLDQFWQRYNGTNRYCSKEFRPFAQAQIKNKGDGRYTQLNYCYGLHGTIELRLLPMFSEVRLTVDATKQYVKLVESYLSKRPTKASRQLVKRTLYPRFTSLKNRIGTMRTT
jgi:hypothetical protein